jgi:hypothetical protein
VGVSSRKLDRGSGWQPLTPTARRWRRGCRSPFGKALARQAKANLHPLAFTLVLCSCVQVRYGGLWDDHVVPRQHGGSDEQWNRVPVCDWCNFMLSCYLSARSGDTIGRLRWKKKLFLRTCRAALRRSAKWRRLSEDERWDLVQRGRWAMLLPERPRLKYEVGRTCRPGRLVGVRRRWRFKRASSQ